MQEEQRVVVSGFFLQFDLDMVKLPTCTWVIFLPFLVSTIHYILNYR